MTIPCKWCGDPTEMMGTKECDPCHEVRVRIEDYARRRPDVLAKMLPAEALATRDKALEEAIAAICRKADEVASIYHRDNDDLSGLGSAREVLEALRAAKEK